jgi:hypothetical protein
MKTIAANLAKLLSESTSYGLPRIFKSKRIILKIFWLVYFLIGSIATIWFILDTINNYLEYDVVSRIRIISETSMPFPAISICPKVRDAFNHKSIDQIITKCFFNNNSDCNNNANEYFEKFSTWNGDCIRFNGGRNSVNNSIQIRKQNEPSEVFGLKIYTRAVNAKYFIHDPFEMPVFNDRTNSLWTNYRYWKNQVHSVSDDNNTAYRISISKTVEQKATSPLNPCYKDANEFSGNKTIINYIQSNNLTYKQMYCHELCGELLYIQINPCDCTNAILGNVYKMCNINKKFSNCSTDYLENFKKQVSYKEKCDKYCPLECDSTDYSTDQRSNLVNETLVYIFFDDFKYTLISETIKTKEIDLVSSIGGMLGLFIGCSFVSVFELIELIIEVVFILFQKNKRKISQDNRNETNYNHNQTELLSIRSSIVDHLHRISELENYMRSSQCIQVSSNETNVNQIYLSTVNDILYRISEIESHLEMGRKKENN